MDKYRIKDIKIEQLEKRITELREILNKICAESEGTDNYEEKLLISRYLDNLIVEYMTLMREI